MFVRQPEERGPGAPRRCQKGRAERAIRFIRDAFFAGRTFTDLADLNAQALAWCEGPARRRPWPEDRTLSVAQAFEHEHTHLLPLPEQDWPLAERVPVHIGKTPYARFDLNDYSIPHTHVRRTLSVWADTVTVRIMDGADVLATHARSYDRHAQIEIPAHLEALTRIIHESECTRASLIGTNVLATERNEPARRPSNERSYHTTACSV